MSTGQTDEYCLTYEATGTTLEWTTCGDGNTTYTASNGITLDVNNFELGGTLEQDTTIATSTFELYVDNIGFDGNSVTTTTGDLTVNSAGTTILADAVTAQGTVTFTGPSTDITTAGGENLTLAPGTSGDVVISVDNNSSLEVNGTITSTNSNDFYTSTITNQTSSGTQRVMYIANADDAANATTEALMALNNLETTANLVTDYFIINATTTDTTADAIDVSDPELFNAINVGANIIAGTTADINFDNFDVVGSSGNVTMAGTLAVNGDSITADGATLTINAAGTVDIQDNLTVDSLTTDTGGITILAGQSIIPSGAGALTIGNANLSTLTVTTDGTGNGEVVLPNDSIGPNELMSTGQTDEYCLTYETTGTTLEWASCAGTSAGGSDTEVQYNNGGAFGGMSSLTFNDSTLEITATDDLNLTFAGSENLDITSDLVGATNVISITGTPSSSAGTAIGLYISQNDSANLQGFDAGIAIENGDTNLAMDDGILLRANLGTIVDGIDASDAEIVNALNFGVNTLLGTTGNIDMSNFDVVGSTGNVTMAGTLAVNGDSITADGATLTINAAGTVDIQDNLTVNSLTTDTGGITILAGQSIIPSGAGALTIGNANLSTLTVTTDGTGNGEVVLPNDSIGPNELMSTGQTDEYCLTYEATGTTFEWFNCAGSTPGGSDTEVQYNNGSAFGGMSSLTYNDATLEVTATDDLNLTFAGTENLAITSDLAGTVNVISLTGTPSASAGTAYGFYLSQADSANANGFDAGLVIDNLDTNLAMTDGLIISSAAGTIVDAIDASDAELTNALNMGDNYLLSSAFRLSSNGSTWLLEDTGGNDMMIVTDNGTTGSTTITNDLTVSGADITGANSESINIGTTDGTFLLKRNDAGTVTLTANDNDTTAAMSILPGGAAGLTLGGGSMTALTVTTDGTGDAEVVLPNNSIGPNELQSSGQTDEYCLTYETGGTLEWQTCGAFTDAGSYVYPAGGDYIGNNTSGGINKIAGLYLGDSSSLYFGADNDVYFSYDNSASLLNLVFGSTTLMQYGASQVEFEVPAAFNAAGDASFGYDLVMTNQTASKLESYGPLTIEVGESFENNNLTMTTYGTGQLIVNAAGGSTFTVSGAAVSTFDRTTSDGTIISLKQAGTEEGTISVSGTTVSYNAFTGSHYAWTNDTIEQSKVVVLTGDNKRLHNRPTSELLYGIKESTVENDPQVLGAYLALQESTLPASTSNPHLIMAVGNGDMWVVDEGENIATGDYLITSNTKGHARKDNENLSKSYVMARAAEPIDWSKVTQTINGKKRAKISITFESFVISRMANGLASLNENTNIPAANVITDEDLQAVVAGLNTEIDQVNSEIATINERLAALENVTTESTQSSESSESTPTTATEILEEMITLIDEFKTFVADLGLSTATNSDGEKVLTVEQNMAVLGDTTLNNLDVTGKLNAGFVQIDSLEQSIGVLGPKCYNADTNTYHPELCESQTLYLQKELAGNVDIFNANIVLTPEGNIKSAGTIEAKKVKTEELTLKDQSIGSGLLTANTTSVTIPSSLVKANSRVFITPTTSTLGQTVYLKAKTNGINFEVAIDSPVAQDIRFDWFIVNEE
jgi:hypothetical protein